MELRELTTDDLPRITALNNAAVPAVPEMTEESLSAVFSASDVRLAAVDESGVIGFLLGFAAGSDYGSANFRYFEDRGTDHLYVDRIVIDSAARGGGVGRVLYEQFIGLAIEQGRAEVTCEVNVDPPNPQSMAFHTRLGFSEVGRQTTGYATVALLARLLEAKNN